MKQEQTASPNIRWVQTKRKIFFADIIFTRAKNKSWML
jgi:hypothetical protein